MVLHSHSPTNESSRPFSQGIQENGSHRSEKQLDPSQKRTPELANSQDSVHITRLSKQHCVTVGTGLTGKGVSQSIISHPIGSPQTRIQQALPLGRPAAVPAQKTLLQMGGGDGDVQHPPHKPTRTILSICGQTNIRVYNRLALCFALPNGVAHRTAIDAHLRKALHALSNSRPEFAARLELAPRVDIGSRTEKTGYICLKQSSSYSIPFESHDLSSTFGYTYRDLKLHGFPAKAFVHPRFDIAGDVYEGKDLPASEIRVYYIDGGMVLGVWLHHGLADGHGVGAFIESLASATRGSHMGVSKCLDLDLLRYQDRIENIGKGKTFTDLIGQCLEYGTHPKPACPTGAIELQGGTPMSMIEKTGRIFVFKKSRLEELRLRLNKFAPPNAPRGRHGPYVSSYNVLAALTWVHVAEARLSTEKSTSPDLDGRRASIGRLMNPVNWMDRALPDATKNYYGNATVLAITELPLSLLHSSCIDTSLESLSRVASSIKSIINTIDDEFVCRRIATYYAAKDPRYLALDIDPRTPQDLGFNTWESIAPDTEWSFPNVPLVKPDRIRRMQGEFNMGGSLIMPARRDATEIELVVTLPRVSMDRLVADRGFMEWVSHVVE